MMQIQPTGQDAVQAVHTLMSAFTASALGVYVIQKLKASAWFPLAGEGKAAANRIIAVLTAIVTATGIHYQFDPAAHQLILSNVSPAMVGSALWHWANQFTLQETLYQATLNSKTVVASGDPGGPTPNISDAKRPRMRDESKISD